MQNTSKIPNLQPRAKPQAPERSQGAMFAEMRNAFGRNGWWFAGMTLLLIYFAICWQGERVLRGRVYNFFKEIGANGFGVSYSEPHSSYLALQSSLYLDDLVITAPKSMGGWKFKAGRLVISLNPLMPRSVSFSMRGTHSLILPDFGDIRLVADKAKADIRIGTPSVPSSLNITADNVQATAPVSMTGLAFGEVSLRMKRNAAEENRYSYSYRFRAENVRLPSFLVKSLPERAEYLALSGTVDGISADRQKPLLSDWIGNGGIIEIAKGEIIWKPLMAEFSGTAAFDPSLELTMAASAKVYGFFDLIDAMEKEGIIRPGNLSVAKVVLGPALTVERGENRPSLRTSFSIQDGNFYAGQVVLFEKETGEEE